MDAVLTSLIAVLGTLGGSLGALTLQQRATARAERRRELRDAGTAFLTALTAYRRSVYILSTNPTDSEAITVVRDARADLTTARDSLLLVTHDPAVRDSVPRALDAAFALGDDIEQTAITTGRPAALAAHNDVLAALTTALRTP